MKPNISTAKTSEINKFSLEEIYLYCKEPEFCRTHFESEDYRKLNYLFEYDSLVQRTFLSMEGVSKQEIEKNLALFEKKKLGVITVKDKVADGLKNIWEWITTPSTNVEPEPVPTWALRLSAAFQFLIIPALSVMTLWNYNQIETNTGQFFEPFLTKRELTFSGNLDFFITSAMFMLLYYITYILIIIYKKGNSLGLIILNVLPFLAGLGIILQSYFSIEYGHEKLSYIEGDRKLFFIFILLCFINALLFIPIQRILKKEK